MKYMGKENERGKSGALWDGKRERKNSVGKGRKVLTQEGGCGNISHALSKRCIPDHARVVELVDSLASGASARKGVRVRLPPRAPKRKTSAFSRCLSFWVPPPVGRLHPSVIEMLGRNEFALRQGFGLCPNACTAQKRRRPEGRLGSAPAATL